MAFAGSRINGILVQPDGRIVVSANLINTNTGVSSGWLLFRLDGAGKKLDSSFAHNGLFTYSLDSAGVGANWKMASAGAIAGTANGGLLVSAVHGTTTNGYLDVFRLTAAGRFDSTFARSSGFYSLQVRSGFFLSFSKMAVDSAGNLAVLGYSGRSPLNSTNTPGHVVLRLTKDGLPIQTFNRTGYIQYFAGQDTATTNQFKYGSADEPAHRTDTRLRNGRPVYYKYLGPGNEDRSQSPIATSS